MRCSETQGAFRRHEERGAVGEMPTPGRGTLLGDIVRDSIGVCTHIPIDG